jgi:hypothetical protein
VASSSIPAATDQSLPFLPGVRSGAEHSQPGDFFAAPKLAPQGCLKRWPNT